ncbi:transketolase [Marispirochaeta aestuarii]|uniref:transketolase n=1 Tax=Marispirochaeta aestuarii TaxID=1963862 RepID=UPI0029C6C30E|nr:transketolase [Marispirochaeta aestuarii]
MEEKKKTVLKDYEALGDFALQLRRDTVRMIRNAGHGHIGGALGLADFMAVLYGGGMTSDPSSIDDPDRDRLVLSNGHTCAVWYAALARKGFLPLESLSSFRRMGSPLQGHPARKMLPGIVETSTGPLGQGLSVANGIAMSMKLRGSRGRVYCVLGDGELQEGQVWEAAMTSSHYHLDNLLVFINYNNLQIDGPVDAVMKIDPLSERFQAFGWHAVEIDGNDIPSIVEALEICGKKSGLPSVIIGRTKMGKGVPFMEDKAEWHGSCPSDIQTAEALTALGLSEKFQDFPLPEAWKAGETA